MTKISKTEALRLATAQVGQVHYTCGGYGFATWDEARRAWWAPGSQPYFAARSARSEAIAYRAAIFLGLDPDCVLWALQYSAGPARERLNAVLTYIEGVGECPA